MLHTDARFHSAVEDAVGRLEALTDAEIIVVAAPRSGLRPAEATITTPKTKSVSTRTAMT